MDQRALVQRLAHKGFPDFVEVEECVFTVTGQSNEWVQHVLISENEVQRNCERENELHGSAKF